MDSATETDKLTTRLTNARDLARTKVLSSLEAVKCVVPCHPDAAFDGAILVQPDSAIPDAPQAPTSTSKRKKPALTVNEYKQQVLDSVPETSLSCIYFSVLPLSPIAPTHRSQGGYPGFSFPRLGSSVEGRLKGSLVVLPLLGTDLVAAVEMDEYARKFEGRWESEGEEWLWALAPKSLKDRVLSWSELGTWVEMLRDEALAAMAEGEAERRIGGDEERQQSEEGASKPDDCWYQVAKSSLISRGLQDDSSGPERGYCFLEGNPGLNMNIRCLHHARCIQCWWPGI